MGVSTAAASLKKTARPAGKTGDAGTPSREVSERGHADERSDEEGGHHL